MPKRKSKVKKQIREQRLLKSYGDPEASGSLGGVQRFARAHKLSKGEAKKILEKDLGYTLHRPRRLGGFPTLPVLVFSIDEQWVADLVEVQKLARYNKGNRYLLTVIDALSKYAWVEPVKAKTGVAVTEAFGKILKRSDGRKPKKLQTDSGKEFYNHTFQTLMKDKDIVHFSTKGDTKASIVERFNRTFKERMYRYFTVHNTLSYLPVLQALAKGYNASYHRSIKMPPNQVNERNERKVWDNLYEKKLNKKPRKPKFKVENRVRLNKKFRQFKKGYLPGWTEEVFIVSRVIPGEVVTYKIKEMNDTPLEGNFYTQDLQKVSVSDDDLYRVEKVLKRKGNKLLVRWKGWPDKYDSWIDKKDVQKT